jgi:hypothetical protein
MLEKKTQVQFKYNIYDSILLGFLQCNRAGLYLGLVVAGCNSMM